MVGFLWLNIMTYIGEFSLENLVPGVKNHGVNTNEPVNFEGSLVVALPANTTVNGVVINPSGGGSGWVKAVKSYTDFSVADTTSTIDLVTLPAGYVVEDIKVWVATSLDDGAGNSANIANFGVTGTNDFFHTGKAFNAGLPNALLNNVGEFFSFTSSNNGGQSVASSFLNFNTQPSNSSISPGSEHQIFGTRIYSLTSSTTINVTLTAAVNFNTMTEGVLYFYIKMFLLP